MSGRAPWFAVLRERAARRGVFTAGDGQVAATLPSWDEVRALLNVADAAQEVAEVAAEISRTTRIAEVNGDLHAKLASALALLDEAANSHPSTDAP